MSDHALRTSIDLPGVSHANPIPAASRIGRFVATGAITGRDPETGEMGVDADRQFAHVFAHVRRLVTELGGTSDDILKMTFHLADPDDREALNREWLAMFPDPASRPARQAIAARLDRGAVVHCDLLVVLGS